MAEKKLRFEQLVPKTIDELFPFFSDAHNLEHITPPWLNFKVLSVSTPSVVQGTTIDYRLNLHGIPFKWRTLIAEWVPNKHFVDTQLRGPFKLWHHTHEFFAKPSGTLVVDTVRYELPLGLLGDFFGGWMVSKDVNGIFAFRHQIIEAKFGTKAK